MGLQDDVTTKEKIQRFLYTCSYFGYYITGNLEKHLIRFNTNALFQYIQSSPKDFLQIIISANDDPLIVRRFTLFYIMSEALHSPIIPEETKVDIKDTVFKIVKSDEEFFDFLKCFTLLGPQRKQRFTTSLKKMVCKFYQMKQPLEFAQCVTKQDSYHCWTHKDILKLCHYKCVNISCEPVLKYVLFGGKYLPEKPENDVKTIVEHLKKAHELRTTEDVSRAVALMEELHATVDQVNSKLNRNEDIWFASLSHMTTREVLQSLYKIYKMGFLKPGGAFQAKVIEILSNLEKIKKCNLHPVEVFIYLKFFERGGKTVDPKLLDFLQKKEICDETLKKVVTAEEPKCKPVIQNISKCLTLSYDNVQPIGKRFLITVDVTDKAEEFCFHNKRISYLEAAVTLIRFLSKVEKNTHVSVAVFKDNKINFVDITKSHAVMEKLQEHKSTYIIPSAPIEYARGKKKAFDVFINVMAAKWYSAVPAEVKDKMEKLPDALSKYSKKMKLPDARVVKMFLGGLSLPQTENSKNILSIAGFSVDVPRVLEAFCRGRFC